MVTNSPRFDSSGPKASKVKVLSADQAVAHVKDGDTIMAGGFGLVGAPLLLIDALLRSGVRNLAVISNNLGEPGRGLGKLLLNGQVRKAIGSYFTSNPDVIEHHRAGRIEVELLPQGTLAEAIRAGGAGIPAFYTPTGAGTLLAEGKETRRFRGRECVLQDGLRADVALIRARYSDTLGNLTYAKTARNFNPLMATAADLVIAEVDAVVPLGYLRPEEIVTPHIFVDVVVVRGCEQ